MTATSAGSVTYDGGGNITAAPGTVAFGYDYRNQLVTAGSANYQFDPLNRLYREVGAADRRMQYDGVQLAAEYDSGGTATARYVPGSGLNEVIVGYSGGGLTTRSFPVADERLSVIALSNASGAATQVNTYDEYGVPAGGNAGRFQYTGQMWLPDAGLYHYRARAYAAGVGRFTGPDPIGYAGGANLYGYVSGDPVNLIDLFGLNGLRVGDRVTHDQCRQGGGRVMRDDKGVEFCALPSPSIPGGRGGSGAGPIGSSSSGNGAQAAMEAQLCSMLGSQPLRDARRALSEFIGRSPIDGFYIAQIQGQGVGGIGGGASFGYAVEVSGGQAVSNFLFTSASFASGFNVDVGAGVYYSSISPVGEAWSLNLDISVFAFSLILADGRVGGMIGAEPVSVSTPFGGTVEAGSGQKLECPN